MQSGASGATSVRVAAAALHLAARVAVPAARAEAGGGGGRVGQLEVLLDVVHEAVDDVAVPEEGLEVLLLRRVRRVVTVAATVLLLISLRRHDRAQGEHSGGGHY